MIEIAMSKMSDRTPETSQKLIELREKFVKKHKEAERDRRKRAKQEKARLLAEEQLIAKIRASGVKAKFDLCNVQKYWQSFLTSGMK